LDGRTAFKGGELSTLNLEMEPYSVCILQIRKLK